VLTEVHSNPARRPIITLWLVATIVAITAALLPATTFGNPSPDSQLFLDVTTGKVVVEAYIPVPELALVLGEDIQRSPETLADRYAPQLWLYMMKHIQAYSNKKHPWNITIENIRMAKEETYTGTTVPYWELVVRFILTPQPRETTRTFTLYYDAVLHQVMNHAAIVSIRRDWEGGIMPGDTTRDAGIIGWNTRNNTISPLQVTLERGSWSKGIASMFIFGMRHIRERANHLMFLLVLLLAAPLIAQSRTWALYDGLHYTAAYLLQIVIAFTIGHTLASGVGALGWITLPTESIEIMIALSILIVAANTVFPIFADKEITIIAVFGFIHGLAFAAILADHSLDAGPMMLSALAANLGIAVMGMIMFACIIPWLLLLSRFPWYSVLRIAGVAVISIPAVGWILEQLAGHTNIVTRGVARAAQFLPAAVMLLAIYAMVTTALWGNVKQYWLTKIWNDKGYS